MVLEIIDEEWSVAVSRKIIACCVFFCSVLPIDGISDAVRKIWVCSSGNLDKFLRFGRVELSMESSRSGTGVRPSKI